MLPPEAVCAYVLSEENAYDGRRPAHRERLARVRAEGAFSILYYDPEGWVVEAWRGRSSHLARLLLEEHGFTFEPRRCQWYRGVAS
jgi:hypothetical protein